MDGMVVENDLDRGVDRIGGIEQFEKFDEFAAAVAFPGLRRGRLLTRA
jgi:hypothetical protein